MNGMTALANGGVNAGEMEPCEGPYRKTIVHRDGFRHQSKHPHKDFIEHMTMDQKRVCEGEEGLVKL